MPTKRKHLYALLVGINDYQYPVNPLNGCEADVEQMKTYLEAQAGDDLQCDIRTLLNQQATKAEIAQAFLEQLGQAGPGDVALFYFSGHGARERADTALWKNEADGFLEGLACMNESDALPPLLADKELRWLIQQVSSKHPDGSPHILLLTDCCHSGDTSRGFLLNEDHPLASRQLEDILDQRPWEDFLFHEAIEPKALQSATATADVLPEGPHLHLAACQDRQRAKEAYFAPAKSYGGVFTTFLLEELKAGGDNLSYYELFRRLKLKTRYQYDQIVQLYVPGSHYSLPFRGFLDRAPAKEGSQSGKVRFSKEKGWYVDRGALHGLSARQKEIEVTVEAEASPVKAAITEVLPDQTLLRFPKEVEAGLDTQQAYSCSLGAYPSAPLGIFVRDDEGLEDHVLEELRMRLQSGVANLNLLPHEGGADYTLQLVAGDYRLTPAQDPFRPVVQPIPMEDPQGVDRLVAYLRQIAQWTYLRDLESPQEEQAVFKGSYPVELILETNSPDQGWRQVEGNGRDLVVAYQKELAPTSGEAIWAGDVRIAVKSHFDRNLYVTLIYLQQDFSTYAKWNEQRITFPLQPGERLDLFENKFTYENMLRDYNWPESVSHFTLIASTQENIDLADLLIEDGLPMPLTLAEATRSIRTDKGIKTIDEEDMPIRDGWIARPYTLRMPNPEYNRISRQRLDQMLQNEALQEYAMGLYLDTEPLNEELTLAAGITWQEAEAGEKGLVWDTVLKVANTVATKLRRKEFNRRMRRYPHRTLVVSEGDSWFQHPTIRETIDHLSCFFNIYSVGLAGAEMRTYFSTGAFVDALDEVERQYKRRPRILLLSGGGNDILGAQFRDFLAPALTPGADPTTYLNERFHEELAVITEMYERVFERMANAWPEVDIITHGYDYVPAKARKKGWVNPYLMERGLTEEEDRRRCIAYLIDTFNEALIKVGDPFERVHHVDVRHVVKPYQWHDEIHPDREGYQEVAMHFMKKIEDILGKDN